MRLDSMTDAGEFERLATAVLRRATPAYSALVHSGVNAQGRPIPSPVDGFSLSGGAEDLVLAAHTTMALSSLRTKWLDPENGDIAKAATTANRVSANDALLVLTLNREPSLDLVYAAKTACKEAGLRLDLWSQSRLADFLDDDPEGQWIRYRFFGEPETRLSVSALRAMGEAGPVDLALFDAPAALTPRQAADDLASRLRGGQRLVLLNAASGQGKTVVAAQVWRRMVETGAGAVHVSHQDVEASVSLSDALELALRRRSPALALGCGRDAIGLAGDNGLLILVEDINRAIRPLAALQKVALWSRQATATGLRLLCPVWPRALAGLSEQERKAVSGSVTWLEFPTHAEAVAIAAAHASVQGRDPSILKLDAIVQRLGRDPLLLGLHDYGGDATDGVQAFVEREATRVAQTSGLGGADLLDALEALAVGMLQARSLEPIWRDVRSWVGVEKARWVLRLLDAGVLMRLSGDGADERVVFRHDRVRDQIRAFGLRRLLEDDPSSEVLKEPAYAELWGQVLSDSRSRETWIDQAAKLNPLGIFCGLAASPTGSSRRTRLAAAAAYWLRQDGVLSNQYAHLRWGAQYALAEMEGPEVSELLPLFAESTWMTREAACRNGDMEAALGITVSWDPYRLAGREKWLFEHLRTQYAAKARAFVEVGLSDPATSPSRRIALLGMAGRLRDPALEGVVVDAWRGGPRTPGFINASLWAAALCAPGRMSPILDAWTELGEGPLEHGRTPRGSVGYDLRQGLWEMAGLEVLEAFLDRARDLDDPLAFYIGNILEGWDHPDAQERYVRLLAQRLARSRASGGYGLAGLNLGEMWGEEGWRAGSIMSDRSLARVERLWTDPNEDRDVHTVALRLWGHAARPRHLASIRDALDPLGPLGSEAVCALIFLDDPLAPAALDGLIEAEPDKGYLWQYVRGRWRDAYLPYLVKALERRRILKATNSEARFSGDHALPDLMRWLDDTTRTQLLSEHWDHLGEEKQWVQLALWTATPQALGLAKESLTSGNPREILRFISQHYNLYPNSMPPTVDLRRLEALEPWLDHLDDHAFRQLEEHCNRLGWRDWRRINVDPRLEPKDPAYWRTAASRRDEFERIANADPESPHVHFALQQMLGAVGEIEVILGEVDAWLRNRADSAALRTACQFVIEAAARAELPRLEEWRNLNIPKGEVLIDDAIFALKRRSLT